MRQRHKDCFDLGLNWWFEREDRITEFLGRGHVTKSPIWAHHNFGKIYTKFVNAIRNGMLYWCCDIEVEPTALRVWRRDRSTLVSVPSNEGGHAWSSHTDLVTFGLRRCRHNIWCKISIGRGWQSRWIFLIWGFAPFELFNVSHCVGEADMRQGTSFKSTYMCVQVSEPNLCSNLNPLKHHWISRNLILLCIF